MRLRTPLSLLAMSLALTAPALAQTPSGPPETPTTPTTPTTAPAPAPLPRAQSDMYVPLYGVTAGIAIPAGRFRDDHAAGYELGGLIEYAVANQPYSLRGEVMFQRFPLKQDRITGRDANLLSLGTTIVYRLQQDPAETFVTAGIAIYNATDEGTRPGFNVGTGIGIPLTGFSALAEVRLHVMLADGRPVLALPLTVGVRF